MLGGGPPVQRPLYILEVCVCVCVCMRERERERDTDRYTERETKERDRETERGRTTSRQRQTETERQTDRDRVGAGLVFMYEGGVCLRFWSCGVLLRVSSAVCLISQYLCVWLGVCVCLSAVSTSLGSAPPLLAGTQGDSPCVPCRSHPGSRLCVTRTHGQDPGLVLPLPGPFG